MIRIQNCLKIQIKLNILKKNEKDKDRYIQDNNHRGNNNNNFRLQK